MFDVLASSTVAWNVRCAFNASGLERMGLAGGSREMIKFIGGRFEWIGIWSKSVKIQSPFGLGGLERIGF